MIVTPFYAGLLALWFVVLSARVSQRRRQGKFPLGDGGDAQMLRVIRGHANFAEYVPLILLMMAMLELGHTSKYLLHALGIALLVGRLLHGYALSFTQRFFFGRFWGTGLTWLALIVCAVLCVWQGVRGFALT
jgi:uncharacterized membrane protein YecN with MAPEG domain